MNPESLNFSHLISMSDSRGLFEHANFDKPRLEHGYCVDDVARAIILLERTKTVQPQLRELLRVYFEFILAAQSADGQFKNRCNVSGIWTTPAQMGDHWGHALWALGTVALLEADKSMAEIALNRFELSCDHRTHYLRPLIYASLGAAAILNFKPDHLPSLKLLRDTLKTIHRPVDQEWPWPEERLTYGNAVIPEFLMLAGHHLHDAKLLQQGVTLLKWLVDVETRDNHFSVTPTNGWQLGELRPGFDQQPIELAAMADACATAFELTYDPEWLNRLQLASDWFEGFNDLQMRMYEPMTGAGFDGLDPFGRNENRGAESTLSYLSVGERISTYLSVLR
jgi:hypothetical protein